MSEFSQRLLMFALIVLQWKIKIVNLFSIKCQQNVLCVHHNFHQTINANCTQQRRVNNTTAKLIWYLSIFAWLLNGIVGSSIRWIIWKVYRLQFVLIGTKTFKTPNINSTQFFKLMKISVFTGFCHCFGWISLWNDFVYIFCDFFYTLNKILFTFFWIEESQHDARLKYY